MSVERKLQRKRSKVVQLKKKPRLKLKKEDGRWFENLVLKETVIKSEAQKGLLAVAKEAEEMMDTLSKREGVDLRLYDINWQTMEAKLKTKRRKNPAKKATKKKAVRKKTARKKS